MYIQCFKYVKVQPTASLRQYLESAVKVFADTLRVAFHRLFGANSWIFKSSFTVCAFMFSPTLTPEESRAKPWSSYRVFVSNGNVQLTYPLEHTIRVCLNYVFVKIYIYKFCGAECVECVVVVCVIKITCPHCSQYFCKVNK